MSKNLSQFFWKCYTKMPNWSLPGFGQQMSEKRGSARNQCSVWFDRRFCISWRPNLVLSSSSSSPSLLFSAVCTQTRMKRIASRAEEEEKRSVHTSQICNPTLFGASRLPSSSSIHLQIYLRGWARAPGDFRVSRHLVNLRSVALRVERPG